MQKRNARSQPFPCYGPRRFRSRTTRRGIAAVEFAVILPAVILVILASLEITRGFTVQHALQEAAMNGCRIYTLGDKDQADAQAMIDRSLAEAGILGYAVAYTPATKAEIVSDLQPVSVTVTVPYSRVGIGIEWFLAGTDIAASVTLPADSPPPAEHED
ncbi:TadE/TadG family type IV pilus assembly protein [Roseimaritima sediminicola]|uniref:TadE/TadG family type IV pilus assembly protein n=1 Tax=Roseimaritima sediminicola TaxID=2662066 RepID=UPI001298257C|nr:TadE/TadG family type IV pilus assembly protein [Roseimaritima sediminicola]